MSQDVFTAIHTVDKFHNLRLSRVLLESLAHRLEFFPMAGLTPEQSDELGKLCYLLQVYQSHTEPLLTELSEELDRIVRFT